MNIRDLVSIIEESPVFQTWKKTHKKSYLVHFFTMADDGLVTWEVGFYNSDDTISSFAVMGEQVELNDSAQIFKKTAQPIPPLDITKVHTHFAEILEQAFDFAKTNYPKEQEVKRVVLLQHSESGQIWNITFITASFKTLNMKFDADTGKLIKHSFGSLIDDSKTEEVNQK